MGIRKYKPGETKLVDVDLQAEAEKWKDEQQESLIIDFDQAVEEEKAKATMVKFQGQTYKLPKSAPAWLPLFVNRHGQGPNNELTDKKNLELIEHLLGKDFASKIADDKNNFVSLQLVNDKILEPVMKQWGFEGASADKKK